MDEWKRLGAFVRRKPFSKPLSILPGIPQFSKFSCDCDILKNLYMWYIFENYTFKNRIEFYGLRMLNITNTIANFTTIANHPDRVLIVRHARKVEPNQCTGGLLQLMKILHPIHLFFFGSATDCLLDSIGGCGDVTGILGHEYIAIFCSFLNSWYTLSSDTTSWV